MLRVIVVDDEGPARSELKYLLEKEGGVEVVAEASSVRTAIEALKGTPCDVVFLDIEMPDSTGIQLARALCRIKSAPAVVFTTAYGQYAADAFGVNALDYLVKPVEEQRLAQTLARVRKRLQSTTQIRKMSLFPVRKNGKNQYVRIGDITFISAMDDYSCLHTESARYQLPTTLGELERRLEGYGFFRTHRSFLVNLDRVDEYKTVGRGALLLFVSGVKEGVPVARRRVPELKKALGI